MASDEFEGRGPGTEGERKTLAYLESQWAKAGLKPGARDGSWYQPVELVRRGPKQANVQFFSKGDKLRIVSDDILLYRVSGRLVYKNDLRSSCNGLGRDNDIIVTRTTGTGPCRGDIITLVDRTSGIGGGSCSLGEFTPYRTPSAD